MADTKQYLSQITLPSGSEYYLKDAEAREAIETLSKYTEYLGVTTTELVDGETTSATITVAGKSVTAKTGDIATYGNGEFVYNGTVWQEFGDLGALGDLAYKDEASGAYTPAGEVTVSTATTSNETATVSAAASGDTTYAPSGEITLSNSNVTSEIETEAIDATHAKNYTPAGEIGLTNSNVTSTVAAAASGENTYVPSGSVSFSTSNVAKTVGTEQIDQDHAATYTPAGSVGAPTVSVATAGATSTVNSATAQTVAKKVVAAAPGATAPDNSLTYYNVSGEVLSLYQLGYTTGDSISTEAVTVKVGDAAYEASAPTFSGTSARLVTEEFAIPSSASFSGDGARLETTFSIPSSATFSGSDARLVTTMSIPSSASFSGTAVRLVTSGINVPATYSATFSGTPATVTVS